jgi:putative heme transporter
MHGADPQEPSTAFGGDPDAGSPPSAAGRRTRPIRVVASLVLAAALLFGVLPQLADLSEVWAVLRGLSVGWSLVLLAGAAWNIATYQFVMMSALPGLSMGKAFVAGQLSTALANTLPAGAVVGVGVTYTVLRSFGHGARSIAVAATLTGVWNTFVKLGLPVIALALLAVTGAASRALLVTAAIGVAILIAALVVGSLSLSSEPLALRIGDGLARIVSRVVGMLGRPPATGWGERLARFQRESIGLLRDRWGLLTAATLVSHLSLFLMLLLSLRAVGVGADAVTAIEALGVFAFVRLVTALPLTPGGLGVVELGMAGALGVAGGPQAPVVAAVLLYRGLTYAVQVPLGALSYVVWRRSQRAQAGR